MIRGESLMEFEPCGQRIVVKRLAEEEISGLLLPKDVKKRTLIGEVLHAGPDATWISVGDKILFATFSGFEPFLMGELKTKYEDCLIMNCEDVLARIKEVPCLSVV
jgi:co-chaperonin GroES (HSP10)